MIIAVLRGHWKGDLAPHACRKGNEGAHFRHLDCVRDETLQSFLPHRADPLLVQGFSFRKTYVAVLVGV